MRKIFAIILAVVLAVSLCSCGGNSLSDETGLKETVKADDFDLDGYKEKVSEFRSSVYEASIILGNIGVYENNYWKALGSLSDNMVESAFDWLAENSDESKETVEANNENIRAAYKELALIDVGDDGEAAEIDAGVRALYDGYSELYSTVLNPSGSRGYFATSVSDLMSEVQSANDDLLLFLPEETQ